MKKEKLDSWKLEESKLRKLFEEDYKMVSEVAKIYNVSTQQIRHICKILDIDYKAYSENAKLSLYLSKWSEDEINLIKELRFKGESYKTISNYVDKSAYEIETLCNKLNIEKGKKIRLHKHDELIDKIRDLVNDGYTRAEIGEMLGLHPSIVLELKRRNNIKKPSIQELQDRGIFYVPKRGQKDVRVETNLTKNKLIELLDEGLSRRKIAQMYGLGPRMITYMASRLNKQDERRVKAINLKKRLILEITGKDATDDDLRKGFVKIFTKEYVEELLKRNEYNFNKCSENELDGIDPKCLHEAVKKFNIEIPEDLQDDLNILWRDLPPETKRLANSLGEYHTRVALEELNLNFNWQVFRSDIVPKDIRPVGVLIDFSVIYNDKLIYIEFNGPTHYEHIPFLKISEERFISQVKRDMWVKKYCNENNINFIEIPYTFNSIKKIKSLLQKVIIEGQDINSIIDYEPFYKEIKERGVTIEDY